MSQRCCGVYLSSLLPKHQLIQSLKYVWVLEYKVNHLLFILGRELFKRHKFVWKRSFNIFWVNSSPFFIIGHRLYLKISSFLNFSLYRVNALHECPLNRIDVCCVTISREEISLRLYIFIFYFLIFMAQLRNFKSKIVTFLVYNLRNFIYQSLFIVLVICFYNLFN